MPPLVGSNELGFWEPESVVQAHEEFLAKVGSSWDDVAPLPDAAFVSGPGRELRQQLSLLVRDEYDTSALFVVKDPRISRLLPLWFAVLGDLQVEPCVAITVRNPLEVAASLKARDGFTTTKSLLLWLRHALEAERDSRGRSRSIVIYDELLRDWQGVLARASEELSITWPGNSHRAAAEIETFLSEQHRHHAFDWKDLEGRRDVVSWVKEAYFALRSSSPLQTLDQIRDELSRADTAFTPIVEEARMAARASETRAIEAAAALDALATEVEGRRATIEARDAEIRQLQDEVARQSSAVVTGEERLAERQIEIDGLRTQRDGFAHEVEVLAGELDRLATAAETAQSRAAQAEREVASARHQATETTAERERLLVSLEAVHAEAAGLREQVVAAKTGLIALEAQAAADRRELLDQLQQARSDLERLEGRAFAAESHAAADREKMLSDLEVATTEASGLAAELDQKSRETDEVISVADALLSIADAELETSRAERDRAESAVADALEENGELLLLIERLEAAVASNASAMQEREEAASTAMAAEATARRLGIERSKLLADLDAARAGIEVSGSELELARNELNSLKVEAASERAALISERDAASAREARFRAELEAAHDRTERLEAETAELEVALQGQRALLGVLQAVTNRRSLRRRSVSQLGTWLLPPTPRKLRYLRQYLLLRRSGEFDADSYLLANPDVIKAGLNPLMHYVEYGRSEGRQLPRRHQQLLSLGSAEPDPSVATTSTAALNEEFAADAAPGGSDDDEGAEALSPTTVLTDELRATLNGEFDSNYYRGTYEDIDRAAIDPLEHYFHTGWREGRDPSPEFSTSYYLSSNPDVAAEGVNPLVHYVLSGRRDGRQPYPPTGFRRQTLQTLRSLEEEVSHWQQAATVAEVPMECASLAAALVARIGARRYAVVSCSHDNYTQVVGGAQLCVVLEQKAFVEEGCAYINLHPAVPLPILSGETQPEALDLCVLCDGERVGSASASAVLAAFSNIRSDLGIDFGLVIHALHGHSPEVIVQLHHHLAPRWAWLWLHDYFGICPNANLLRNRIEPCGAPPPDSPGCTICIFGEERLRHVPRFRWLLESVPFNLVAPSQFMADRWKQYFGNNQLTITVHENGRLSRTTSRIADAGSLVAQALGPIRVAFLGAPATHKGWGVFLDLARRNAGSTAYRFYHFGDGRYRTPNVETRTVNVLKDDPLAMIGALRDESIDLAVLWSLWEESFSYTAHEALAAGVAILTNKGSGNIARIVAESDDGLVFGDERELFASFDDGLITELVHARRKNRNLEVGDFAHSRMTADLSTFDD